MSSAAVGGAAPVAVLDTRELARRGWIAGPVADLALLTLSPLAGVLVAVAALAAPWGASIVTSAVYFVAIPHYLSTFTFYLGDDTRAYYRTRWIAFFLGPVICAGAVLAALATRHAALFQSVQFTWNIYHVSLQSAGILGLYRWLNGGPAAERRASTVLLVSTAAAMAFLHVDRFAPLAGTLAAIHPVVPRLLFPAAASTAAVSGVIFMRMLARRARPIALPEAAFLASGLLMFHPYLWVADANLATFAMLLGHFLQYLTVVWLVHRRKYVVGGGSPAQQALAFVSRRTSALVAAIVATGLLFLTLDRGTRALGIPWAYQLVWNVIVIVHFYLDGVIWTFRRPRVRETIGAYLILPGHRTVIV